ncbi:MAG TPA: methyltransferase domain-containing protein [Candidatus Manganitrophaceae bacterium]|nr:methyltransferase domain-containing protein [Candidatus Manganitrophaceae bacterium]
MTSETPKYPHIGRKEEEVDPAFWARLYQSGETGWDQGGPSPGLVDFLNGKNYVLPGRILVPGAGRGHDARALARAGFGVTGIDAVASAVEQAVQLARAEKLEQIEFVQADFFDLPSSLRGPYDWIFEHTFFCAIDPALRDRYVEIAADLLKPSGRLLGVFFNIQPESGPPFGTTRRELIDRFTPYFNLLEEAVPRSLPNREGKELLMLWQRS